MVIAQQLITSQKDPWFFSSTTRFLFISSQETHRTHKMAPQSRPRHTLLLFFFLSFFLSLVKFRWIFTTLKLFKWATSSYSYFLKKKKKTGSVWTATHTHTRGAIIEETSFLEKYIQYVSQLIDHTRHRSASYFLLLQLMDIHAITMGYWL